MSALLARRFNFEPVNLSSIDIAEAARKAQKAKREMPILLGAFEQVVKNSVKTKVSESPLRHQHHLICLAK